MGYPSPEDKAEWAWSMLDEATELIERLGADDDEAQRWLRQVEPSPWSRSED